MDSTQRGITARIDGCDYSAKWSNDEVLLDALIRSSVDVPYSCQEGHCGACVCRIVEGSVSMIGGSALTESDIEDGYILACQALPTSPEIHVSYDD
ncbi:2Fe-2S iron-sulfur cluster binding domain-containing protein [Mycolicibacterium sp. CH28]|uniref:2Fe-2S iron-sulfur cluster-binding protein n=1 Tax=Mycolicibacterium sp. CH28 TaxID=2512237 RepID=UPI0010812954|nr:2Fe-2S iron-sulfur cluster binding domain-containing protein [Mycolicibacterium sp. CH28]TGD87907.1 2Fe-2S iron-sulfur cluster binding domain-containing protein [Mycolicibacterium sp. CH28]